MPSGRFGGGGGSLPTLCSSSGSVCLWVFSLSAVRLFHVRYHGCFGLSSFIKGSGVSESLWCFLSRGGSTLLQRVHEGERMYPPLGSIGWWEPGDQTHNSLLPAGIQSLGRYRCIWKHTKGYDSAHHTKLVPQSFSLKTLLI